MFLPTIDYMYLGRILIIRAIQLLICPKIAEPCSLYS